VLVTKYRISLRHLQAKIAPINVVRETKQFVWTEHKGYDGRPDVRQRAKDGEVFETWAEAHAALLAAATRSVDYAKRQLQERRSTLGQIQSMCEPE